MQKPARSKGARVSHTSRMTAVIVATALGMRYDEKYSTAPLLRAGFRNRSDAADAPAGFLREKGVGVTFQFCTMLTYEDN